jgi:hypothetical protein
MAGSKPVRGPGGTAHDPAHGSGRTALAKLERGFNQDLLDVEALLARGLIDPERLRATFEEIEPLLFRFPTVDTDQLRNAVEETAS